MSYQKTDETKPDGRPIWVCPQCGARVAGYVVAFHGCGSEPAKPSKRTTFADYPCVHRGVAMASIEVPGCGCKTAVKACGKFALCAAEKVTGTINNIIPKFCGECDKIQAPSVWVPPSEG